jgi:ubiquinone/menaquinone biosynthesis C-methylase UbiE
MPTEIALKARRLLGRLHRASPKPVQRLYARLVRFHARWVRRQPDEVVKSNTKRAFDHFFSDEDFIASQYLNESRLKFYDCVADQCAKLIVGPTDVVDVGFGTGHFLLSLQERAGAPLHLAGMDFSTVAVARAKALVPEADLREADAYDIPWPENSFSLVVCMEMLEHLKSPGTALEQLVRICRPGGSIVLTVPNGEKDDWDGHRQFWDPTGFRRFVEEQVPVCETLDWTEEHGAIFVRALKPAAVASEESMTQPRETGA